MKNSFNFKIIMDIKEGTTFDMIESEVCKKMEKIGFKCANDISSREVSFIAEYPHEQA